MNLNPENKCSDLAPKEIPELQESDSFRIMYEMQTSLQRRLGQLDKYQEANMQEKMDFVKDNIVHIMVELGELLERTPFKHWKKYSEEMKAETVD